MPTAEEIEEYQKQEPPQESLADIKKSLDYLMSKDEEQQIKRSVAKELKEKKSKKLKPTTGFVKTHKKILMKAVRDKLFSTAEKTLLFDLIPFCNIESNIITDEDGLPMTQQDIVNLVGKDKKYVQEILNGLIQKGLLTKVFKGKNVYYRLSSDHYGG